MQPHLRASCSRFPIPNFSADDQRANCHRDGQARQEPRDKHCVRCRALVCNRRWVCDGAGATAGRCTARCAFLVDLLFSFPFSLSLSLSLSLSPPPPPLFPRCRARPRVGVGLWRLRAAWAWLDLPGEARTIFRSQPPADTWAAHLGLTLPTAPRQVDRPKQIKLHGKGKAVAVACGYYHTAVVLGGLLWGPRVLAVRFLRCASCSPGTSFPLRCRLGPGCCVRRGRRRYV